VYEEPNLIFADCFDDPRVPSVNDFLVKNDQCSPKKEEITQFLLELMAHKRSRLFGLALANRIVTLMLPGTVLAPIESESIPRPAASSPWFVQALVSFIRSGPKSRQFRKMYAVTFFLLPVNNGSETLTARTMSSAEIKEVVNPGWGFAAAPPLCDVPRFQPPESLLSYLKHTSGCDLEDRAQPPCRGLTLRQVTEKIVFGVGLTLAQGKGSLGLQERKRIGNNVVMSLGSARVSAVTVVDGCLGVREVKKPAREVPFPGALLSLMETLARPARRPKARDRHARKYRLDRPFIDGDIYAIGVLPTKRCMVVASRLGAQYGMRESALMQAGSVAHMAIGAATAIGTMREIDQRLEFLEGGADPTKIAKIDAEIASDLAEIYDLDITRESYRAVYQRLRDRLGISRDYKTLQDRMEMLYRATSTFHEDKEERMLVVLTAAIVLLSVFILIGTVVIASHGG